MSEVSKAYSRGYAQAARKVWPPHKPPIPPDERIAGLVKALMNLRDGVDAELAKFGEDDEIEKVLGPLVAAADAELAKLTEWVRE